MEKLFAYGTLLSPKTQIFLINKTLSGLPDSLVGYRKTYQPIDGLKYPVAVRDPACTLEGKVFDVTFDELRTFDVYEGEEYRRIKERLKSGTLAWVYVR